MIPFYLRLLPGEHIYSWFARRFWLSGYTSIEEYLKFEKVLAVELKPNTPLLKSLPTVCNIASGAHPQSNLSALSTTLPVWALSLSQERFINVFNNDNKGKWIHFEHIRAFDALALTNEWKACKICMAEDLSEHGSSIWHTKHQLSGFNHCYKHRTDLVTPIAPLRNLGQLLLPHQIKQWKAVANHTGHGLEEFYKFYSDFFDMASLEPAWALEVRNQLYELLGIARLNSCQRRMACDKLELQLSEELGNSFLLNFFTYYSNDKKSNNCGVLPSIARTEAQQNKIRNPIYWIVALFWKRHELKLLTREPRDECTPDLQTI